MSRSVWILEMLDGDKHWVKSIDNREAYWNLARAEEAIKEIYWKHGKNVTYRAVRYSAQQR